MTNKVKLGEIVSLRKGKKVDFSDEKNDSSVRFIQIDDLRNDNNLKYTSDEKAVLIGEEDILIAWDGANAGTVGYNLSGAIGSTITSISLNKDSRLIPSYFGLFLKSKSKLLRERATGATIPHLSRDVLMALQVPIVEKEQQRLVISLFEKLDAILSERQQQLVELDNLVKSRYCEELEVVA